MTRMTTLQKTQLNRMNRAAQNAGLGTRLDSLEYGTLVVPAVGTVSTMSVMKYNTTPVVGTATATHAAVTLGATETTVTTGITNPDFPRVLTVKGNASGITGNVVITGTDILDAVLTETIALNAATEVVGVKAFKTVTSILLPAKTNGSGDTVSIGRGNLIGFPVAIPNTSLVIAKSFDGAVDSGTVTASATVAASVFALAGTLNGTKILSLVFLA